MKTGSNPADINLFTCLINIWHFLSVRVKSSLAVLKNYKKSKYKFNFLPLIIDNETFMKLQSFMKKLLKLTVF